MNAPGRLRVAVLMMEKNERERLPLFLRYHESLVGSESLFVFDNGSSDPSVIDTLRAAEKRGVHVFWGCSTPQHFIDKGEIFSGLIKRLDAEDPYDFYFPLDCDEFLACDTPEGPSCRQDAIERALSPLRGHPAPLAIKLKYLANPLHRNRYMIYRASPKFFFARDGCEFLDHGFHHPRSRKGLNPVESAIVYFEFHQLPYARNRQCAVAKILPYHQDFSRQALRHYAATKRHNFHCVYELFESKFAYLSRFTFKEYPIQSSSPLDVFSRLGVAVDALFEPVPIVGLHSWLVWLRVRSLLHMTFEEVSEFTSKLLRALRWRTKALFRSGGHPGHR